MVADFSDLGELVCDPYAGSGTTGIACAQLGRRFLGWEHDTAWPSWRSVASLRDCESCPCRAKIEMFG